LCNRCDVSPRGIRGYDPLEYGSGNGSAKRAEAEPGVAGTDLGSGQNGAPFAELVRVRNVSNGGAVLVGVRAKIQTGELLDVQLGSSRTQFRIVWMGFSGEAGIEALAFEPPMFGMDIGIGLPKFFEMVGTG
jgi:hypothetical protein